MVSRTSTLLLRTRSRSMPTRLLCSPGFVTTKSPSPRVPTEIIDHILGFLLLQSSAAPGLPDFTLIEPLTLASAAFRQIALRRYFYELTLTNHTQWEGLFRLLEAQEGKSHERGETGGFAWVRSLSASSVVLSSKPMRLRSLSHLRSLTVDLALEGLSTQHPFLTRLFASGPKLPMNPWPNLTSLTLSYLPRVDTLLLRLIAKTFPGLSDLYLSCTERMEFGCCWACFEESLTCTIHSPIPDEYFDTAAMADAFADALRPLTHLTHLHLGIFLSDERLLYSHIAHSGNRSALSIDWSSCHDCFGNAVEIIRSRELVASIVLAQKIKALETVGWSSLVTSKSKQVSLDQHTDSDDTLVEDAGELHDKDDREYDGSNEENMDDVPGIAADNDMKTTIWILRSNGRIRVRRAPW